MTRDSVYIAFDLEKYQIQNECFLNMTARSDQFHFSPEIDSQQVAMVFPKVKSKLAQKVYDNLGWISSFGLMDHHFRQLETGNRWL